jgi:epoxide hydrolase A/B
VNVEANGLRFHVAEQGEGPAVLLLHGFPDTGEVWRRQLPALAVAGFRAIAPDLRGRGRATDRTECRRTHCRSS